MKLSHKKNLMILVALLCICNLQSFANNPTFYYQIYSEAKPTGYGKVYASDKEEPPTDSQYKDVRGTAITGEGALAEVKAITKTAYLWAKPEDGYMFTHWARFNPNNDEETVISWSKYTSEIFTTGGTTPDEAKKVSYRAYFAKKGALYPVSSDEGLGTVMIDIPDNKIGDEVTITAQADKLAGKFLGWRFENSQELITNNPYTIKVNNSNKGTYTAVFESKETATKGLYCYIRSLRANRRLGVTGSVKDSITIDEREFKHSLMLLPDENFRTHNIPSTVIKVIGESTKSGGLKGVEMIAQGVSTYTLAGAKFRVERADDGKYYIFGFSRGISAYIKDFGRGKRSIEFIGNVISPTLANRLLIESESQWYLEVIDEDNIDDNYFGAMPDANCTKNGKYYTTMYTAFPYKCMDGVKAYTVDRLTDTGIPHLKKIENGIVPAYTAVVLECKSTITKENRLLPLTEDVNPIPGKNMLKGEIWLDDGSGDEANYRTLFDPSYMRILGNDAKFSNINYTDPVSGNVLTYIANNTCYLDLSGEDNIPDELDFTTTGNVLKGDVDGNGLINVTDVTVVINYILNRPVTTFIFENADVKEDQIINMSDVTAIINIILQK